MNSQVQVEDRRRHSAGKVGREKVLAGLPVADRRVELAGIPTAVLEGGDGPPIVLLHGQGEFAATPQLGVPPIPRADLARIPVPTTLIWGRDDLQVRLRIAERASERYGWPLHVIDGARDDPAIEQPEAFLEAVRPVLASN